MPNMHLDRQAPEGMVWQCTVCGKYAEERYGIEGWHDRRYDASCMLNAQLVKTPIEIKIAIKKHYESKNPLHC